jgi:hypothetical protein
MVTLTSELLVELSDLEHVVIRCASCKGQIRVAAGATLGESSNAPPALCWCPVCQAALDSSLMRAVELLRRFLTTLQGHSATIALQARLPKGNPSAQI